MWCHFGAWAAHDIAQIRIAFSNLEYMDVVPPSCHSIATDQGMVSPRGPCALPATSPVLQGASFPSLGCYWMLEYSTLMFFLVLGS